MRIHAHVAAYVVKRSPHFCLLFLAHFDPIQCNFQKKMGCIDLAELCIQCILYILCNLYRAFQKYRFYIECLMGIVVIIITDMKMIISFSSDYPYNVRVCDTEKMFMYQSIFYSSNIDEQLKYMNTGSFALYVTLACRGQHRRQFSNKVLPIFGRIE